MKVLIFLASIVLVAVEGGCPADWTESGGSCWFVGVTKLKWTDASAFCEAFHGELVQIPNQQTKSFLETFISHEHGNAFWIDGTDMLREGHWLWANTNTEIDLSGLGVGSVQDNSNDKNCLYIDSHKHYSWRAQHCDDEAYFVCEHVPIDGGSSILG